MTLLNRKLFYGLCIGFVVLCYFFGSSSDSSMELLGTSPHKKVNLGNVKLSLTYTLFPSSALILNATRMNVLL
jgi:hypothetical protein